MSKLYKYKCKCGAVTRWFRRARTCRCHRCAGRATFVPGQQEPVVAWAFTCTDGEHTWPSFNYDTKALAGKALDMLDKMKLCAFSKPQRIVLDPPRRARSGK